MCFVFMNIIIYIVIEETIYHLFKHEKRILNHFIENNIINQSLIINDRIKEDPIIDIIRKDDINKFQEYITRNKISLDAEVIVEPEEIIHRCIRENEEYEQNYDLDFISLYFKATKIYKKYFVINK